MELEKLLEELDVRADQKKTIKEGVEADEAVAEELKLFIDNDGELYRQHTTPMMKNLARKMVKAVYDSVVAVKLWKYLAEAGARKYAEVHGGDASGWARVFTVLIRRRVAKEACDDFE